MQERIKKHLCNKKTVYIESNLCSYKWNIAGYNSPVNARQHKQTVVCIVQRWAPRVLQLEKTIRG
jgi:hypothetical protein